MIRPCPLTVECPKGEFGTELFGNGDNPFLNLSIEGPEPIWVPPVIEYFTAEGRCCDGILKFSYGDTQALANAALNKKIADECIVCDPNPPKKFCADAKCPDGSLISRVCLTSSYADALTEANRIKAALGKYCPDVPGHSFTSTCSCTDGQSVVHTQTAHSPDSQEAATALCLSSLPNCSNGQDGDNKPKCPVPPCDKPNPFPDNVIIPTGCPPNCPPPPPPGTFCNSAQECTVFCPDGLPFTKHVPAGAFCAATQKAADDKARLYACQRAAIEAICIDDLNISPCLWLSTFSDIAMSGLGTLTPDLIGALPSGMILEKISDTKLRISGAPQEAGIFDFQIIVADEFGNAQVKDFSISVFGVDYDPFFPIPEGAVGLCFSKLFTAVGPFLGQAIWQWGGLPPGIVSDGNGLLSGTPTTKGDYVTTLILSDEDFPPKQCFYDFNWHIRDCATDTYGGSSNGTFPTGQQRNLSVAAIIQIPKQICQRSIRSRATVVPAESCPHTVMIQIEIKKDGIQQGIWNCATVNPFSRTIDQFAMIPAQYPASGACPESPHFNEVWTAEIGYSVGGNQASCPDVSWEISGL